MKTESTGRLRKGRPAWFYATSVGVSLIVVAAIVIGFSKGSGTLIHWGAGDEEALAEQGVTTGEPLVVEDDPTEQTKPTGRKAKTILASLSSSDSTNSERAAEHSTFGTKFESSRACRRGQTRNQQLS